MDAFTATNDRFVSIPGICYLKLTFVRHNRTTVKITIDPLSRIGTPIQPGSVNSPAINENAVAPLVRSACPSPEVRNIPLNIGISVLLKSVVVTVDDEITSPSMVAEVQQLYCNREIILLINSYYCIINLKEIIEQKKSFQRGKIFCPVISTVLGSSVFGGRYFLTVLLRWSNQQNIRMCGQRRGFTVGQSDVQW